MTEVTSTTATATAISVSALAERMKARSALTLLDVRKMAALRSAGHHLPSAQWRDPAMWLDWKDSVPADVPVVVYCAHGQEISQALATALRVMGREVVFLEGGYEAWVQAGQPVNPV
ncbi:rhodanese-like domain-containing protein [Hydrogenophaga sp. PAMC20947]|uniref:rhodanese-like domain-containing protein n=1 Tax=Hydrogenophaga sp. PAMC20947 TaxID=2565558 RepID=UPI00109E16C9|nr:rhodanese-like domain-containing protein [Hydrogenophaga sp. PAMC20947]QCB47604.1 sulfurtransferase [Hydrogenophaga sp. PAMC20947]